MRLKKSALLMVALLVLFSANLMAQTGDIYGAVDTVYAEPYKIDAKHWGINISMFNDEEIIAISVPVTFSAGNNRLVADSTIFTGGRAEAFRVKFARPDTTTCTSCSPRNRWNRACSPGAMMPSSLVRRILMN